MTSEARLDVLVAGDLFFDLVMSGFVAWPRPGEESFAKAFHKDIGGGAAITACGLSKLGLRAAIVGVVGKQDGQWMLDRLNALGVNIAGIRTTATEPTAFTVSVSTSADRTFLTYSGANRELPAVVAQLTSSPVLTHVRHIHLAHATNLAEVQTSFERFAANGRTLSVDVGWHPEWYSDARAIAALKLVDVFFPNEREAQAMTGETEARRMLKSFQKMGVRRVALKLGRAGAALLWDGRIYFQRPGPTEPLDTTGAGDCFDAGFLYARLRGMDPQVCLMAGAACGEMSARKLGGIAGFPSKEELETVLCTVR